MYIRRVNLVVPEVLKGTTIIPNGFEAVKEVGSWAKEGLREEGGWSLEYENGMQRLYRLHVAGTKQGYKALYDSWFQNGIRVDVAENFRASSRLELFQAFHRNASYVSRRFE